MSAPIESANPVVKAIVEGTAPRPAVVAASRGGLPLPPTDLLEVLVALARSSDAELAQNARQTLSSQDVTTLESSMRTDEVASSVLYYFAQQAGMPSSVYEAIITH